MHCLLDVHFSEDKTRIWDMKVQKVLNITRKIVLNIARDYRSEKATKRTALSDSLKRNLFDLNHLGSFLGFFGSKGEVTVQRCCVVSIGKARHPTSFRCVF
jgi:hypothetical protein